MEGLDEVDVMQRYLSYYGEICLEPLDEETPIIVHGLYLHLKHDSPEAFKLINPFLFGDVMLEWVESFRTSHRTMHEAPVVSTAIHDAARECWEFVEGIVEQSSDPEECAEYLRARLQDKDLFAGPRYGDKYGQPKYPLTPRHGYQFPRCPAYNGICREGLFREVLKLPAAGCRLAYFVKSCKTQELVYTACTTRHPKDFQLVRSPLFRAALLEEMFLF